MSAIDQRQHIGQMATFELSRAKRDLAASLALAAPGSPVRVAIERELAAIDDEEAERRRIRQAPPSEG